MIPPVLVPVNRLDRAKGRLAELLSPAQRSELALTTLATVLHAVAGAGGAATVLSADPTVRAAATHPHVPLDESAEASGLNGQLAAAIATLSVSEVLILHGDLPLVTADDVQTLVASAQESPSLTMVESPDGGTNAMLLRPADVIDLHYGRLSASHHRMAGEEAHVTSETVDIRGIALDLDTPADIATLLSTENGRTSAAGRLLRSWGLGAGD